ncbi:MAG TPA: SHOCT domain-containing protein [Solirubrobacteraceae bacterium]|nr:SHOCT domain-containing protein [Solirubrobacteraceae bacterium]
MARRTVAIGCIVLASIVALLAILAIWLNRQALNTDNWAKTSSELLEQPVIQQRVAARLTDELFASVDVEAALADVLPPRAEPLAGPAANALRTQVEKQANKALQRPEVQQLWVNANAVAHAQLMDVLEGGGTTVQTANGEVTLNLKDLLAKLQEQTGVGGRLRKVLPASATEIRLFRSGELSTAQDVVKVLRPLPVVLLLISVGLLAIALIVAPGWRRRAVRGFGFGLIAAGAGALLIRSVAGDAFVNSLASTAAAEPAVAEVWDIATSLLVDVATAAIIYGVVMVAAAWLAGPMAAATAVRRSLAPYLREPGFAYSGLAIVVAIMVWWAPTPAWRNGPMLLILVGLLIAGVEGLRRQVIREFPDATRDAAKRRYRERWANFAAASRRRGEAIGAAASRTAHSASSALATRREPTVTQYTSEVSPEEARLEQLERLAQLRAAGILDDAELRAEKARILQPRVPA